jgi:hypothetical protein
MAGSYPNAPAWRLAYDVDGTVMTETRSLPGGTFGGAGLFTGMILPPVELSTSVKETLNNEASDAYRNLGGPGETDWGYAWIWPEKRDIFGFYGYACDNNTGRVDDLHTSTNSRNGVTGSFTTEAAQSGSLSPSFGSVPSPSSHRAILSGRLSTPTESSSTLSLLRGSLPCVLGLARSRQLAQRTTRQGLLPSTGTA